MRATTGFLVALAFLSAACGTPARGVPSPWASDAGTRPTPPQPTPGPSSLGWKACGEPGERFECATLTVPLDHDTPNGPTVDLAVIRLPAPPAATRLGSLVVNPGGPGASGVEFVRAAAVDTFPTELRTRFDIVGFDPRGVGTSRPITCGGSAGDLLTLDLAPDDDGERRAVLNAAQRAARDCQVTDGDVLPHVSTADVARDLDLLRAALGDTRLTYVGYSYGTFLGASYAALFPDRVRALVLDGAVDPALDAVGRARGGARALEEALQSALAECRETADCPIPPGNATVANVDALLARLERSALPAPYLGSGRALRAGDALLAHLVLLRDREQGWPVLLEGLGMAFEGDGSLLLATADSASGRGSDTVAAYLGPLLAVNCLDIPAPPAADLPRLAGELAAESPRFGAAELYLLAACSYWPVPPQRATAPIAAPGAPPIVVVGATGDAVTPYDWSVSLAGQLENAVLLTRDASRHTAFGGDNVCTDRAVTAYLLELVVPQPGRSCG